MGQELEDLRFRIEAWRALKVSPVERMPVGLWDEATAWAGRLGASAASRALGVGYVGLRRRLGASVGEAGGAAALRGSFVELGGWPSAPMVVETDRADGCRLRLQVQPGSGSEAALVLTAFLGQSG